MSACAATRQWRRRLLQAVVAGLLLSLAAGRRLQEEHQSEASAAHQGTLCVGRSLGQCDVMDGSQPQPGFALRREAGKADEGDPAASPHLHVFGPSEETLELYVSAQGAALTVRQVLVYGMEGLCRPAIVTNLTSGDSDAAAAGGASPSLLRVGQPAVVQLSFGCLRAGTGEVSTSFVVERAGGEEEELHFFMRKECAADLMASQDAAIIPGVDIATLSGVQVVHGPRVASMKLVVAPDVVRDGHVQPRFRLTQEGGYEGLLQVPESAPFLELYIQANRHLLAPLELGVPSVLAGSAACSPTLGGALAQGGTLRLPPPQQAAAGAASKLLEPLDLSVTFNCKSEGLTPVTVRLPVLPQGSITFSVAKLCPSLSDLVDSMASRGSSVPGLVIERLVHLPSGDEDEGAGGDGPATALVVVEDGLTAPKFTERAALTAPEAQVTADEEVVSLLLFMRTEGDGMSEQGIEPPLVFVEEASVVAVTVPNFFPRVQQQQHVMQLRFECKDTGSSRVTVSIPLSPAVGELKFTLLKLCSVAASASALSATAATTEGQEAAVAPPVTVKTSLQGAADVIEQGTNLGVFALEYIHEQFGPPPEELREAILGLPVIKLGRRCSQCMTGGAPMPSLHAFNKVAAGCAATDRCSLLEFSEVQKVLQAHVAASYEHAEGPQVYGTGAFSADFFLMVEEGFPTVHLGDAEVLSYEESVCQPRLLGPASRATILTSTPARLAVTFDCKGDGGSAAVQVKVPVFGAVEGVLSFALVKHCARVSARGMGGSFTDSTEMRQEMAQVTRLSGAGVSVGTAREGPHSMDVVENGLVLPEFVAASDAGTLDAGGYQVPANASALTLWISSAEAAPAEATTIGIPQVLSFNPLICRVAVHEGSAAHRAASRRGAFLLEEPLDMQLAFECLRSGVAVLAVAIPLPFTRGAGGDGGGGGLHFMFRKVCQLAESATLLEEAPEEVEYRGEVIDGLMVGSAPRKADVVRNGQVHHRYCRFREQERLKDHRRIVLPARTEVSFYVRSERSAEGEQRPYRLGVPVAVAHKPVCTPELGGSAAGRVAVGSVELELTLTFHCVWEGQTPVTVALPVERPDGSVTRVVWTLIKRCSLQPARRGGGGGGGGGGGNHSMVFLHTGGFHVNVDGMELADHDGDGLVGVEYEAWMDWGSEEEEDYGGIDGAATLYSDYDEHELNQWKPEEWQRLLGEEYAGWYMDAQQRAAAGADYASSRELYDAWAVEEGRAGDALVAALETRGQDNTHRLEVGTHPMLSDVVREGIAQQRYKLCEEPDPTRAERSCPLNALLSAEETSFFIAAPRQPEELGRPYAKAMFPETVEASIDNADELDGKLLRVGEPVELELRLRCLKRGTTSLVLVHVPHAGGLHSASFSVVRVCGKSVSKAAVAIEATTLLLAAGIFGALVLAFCAGSQLKRTREGRDLTT